MLNANSSVFCYQCQVNKDEHITSTSSFSSHKHAYIVYERVDKYSEWLLFFNLHVSLLWLEIWSHWSQSSRLFPLSRESIGAELGQYILQTHTSKKFWKFNGEGSESPNLPLWLWVLSDYEYGKLKIGPELSAGGLDHAPGACQVGRLVNVEKMYSNFNILLQMLSTTEPPAAESASNTDPRNGTSSGVLPTDDRTDEEDDNETDDGATLYRFSTRLDDMFKCACEYETVRDAADCNSSTAFDYHRLIGCTAKKWYQCEICRTKWSSPSDLAVHRRTHKPYVCDFCRRAFSQLAAFQSHRRIHTGEKPLKCFECDKAFKRPATLVSLCIVAFTVAVRCECYELGDFSGVSWLESENGHLHYRARFSWWKRAA